VDIQFQNYEYECNDDSVWIANVSIDGDVYRVYVDSEKIRVTPSGTVPHTLFGWEDPAFEGLKGNIKCACRIAALIVHSQILVDQGCE
jgi:hypothetical protein